ncbi:GGDEF domain-containing protein [Sphingomonas soli]|uniref:GGDEF domain-containing protein n=1 Tax=Sphingomonas soli TaxID=266127 RepID=UPI00082A6459|nr:GGDEF domain-containing protein [Sphingomonas soli]
MFSVLLWWRAGLIAGSACSLVIWVVALFTVHASWPMWFVLAELGLGGAKWQIASARPREAAARAKAVGRLMLLSIAWALLLGTGIALSIAMGGAELATLAVGVGAGSIGVATFRNAPTPRNARAIILCVVVPPAISGYFFSNGALSLLWVCLVPWCASLFLMVRQNFEVIRQASVTRLELHRLARTDALTGVENRLAFEEYFRESMEGRLGATLLYLDLDEFKQVNDRHGHEAGDALLVDVAHRIRAAVRSCDRVFRLGGDEFAVILDDMNPREVEARVLAMIAQIAQPSTVSPGVTIRVGASVGGAMLDNREPAEAVLRAADAALYQAKALGRGRYVSAATAA